MVRGKMVYVRYGTAAFLLLSLLVFALLVFGVSLCVSETVFLREGFLVRFEVRMPNL